MTQYELDLQYAKDVRIIIERFLNDSPNIFVKDRGHDYLKFSLRGEPVIKFNDFEMISTTVVQDKILSHVFGATKIQIERQLVLETNDIQVGWKNEEQHFQNSLIYDASTVRSILLFSYLMDNAPSQYKHLRIDLSIIPTLKILFGLKRNS
jgi:hypothetical protein